MEITSNKGTLKFTIPETYWNDMPEEFEEKRHYHQKELERRHTQLAEISRQHLAVNRTPKDAYLPTHKDENIEYHAKELQKQYTGNPPSIVSMLCTHNIQRNLFLDELKEFEANGIDEVDFHIKAVCISKLRFLFKKDEMNRVVHLNLDALCDLGISTKVTGVKPCVCNV